MTTTTTSTVSTAAATAVVASMAMVHGKRNKQLLVSLFVRRYSYEVLFGELDMVGFDFKAAMAQLEVEVYANGLKLGKQTRCNHPLSRQPHEAIGAWLDRASASMDCSGVGITVPAALLTPEQVSGLYAACLPPRYNAEVSNSLVCQFVNGETIAAVATLKPTLKAAAPVAAPVVDEPVTRINPADMAEPIAELAAMSKAELVEVAARMGVDSTDLSKVKLLGKLAVAVLVG